MKPNGGGGAAKLPGALLTAIDSDLGGFDKFRADFIAAGLAEQFEAMNPRFDSRRFLDACGVGQN
jgi:hypothetical protein